MLDNLRNQGGSDVPIRSGRQLNSPARVRGMLKRLGNAGRSPTVIGHMEAKTTQRGVRGQPKEGANMVFDTVQAGVCYEGERFVAKYGEK